MADGGTVMNDSLFPDEPEEVERQFVADLVPNQRLAMPFVVKEKSLGAFRNKPGQFLNLTLADKSGEVKARAWDNALELDGQLSLGSVALVTGHVEEYQGQKQVIVKSVRPLGEDEFDPADFVPSSKRPREEMLAQLREDLDLVVDPHLSALVRSFFEDEAFRDDFARAPGAKSLHHSFVGGLMEHTLAVVEVLKCARAIHAELNLDLLIVGGLLHDIGKIWELGGRLTTEYTDEGQLLGHVVITDRKVNERIRELDGFPEDLATQLTHMLLSHHGEREYGAPIVPATLEACALHYADNLDAHLQGFKQVIAQASGQGNWSEYHRLYERRLFLGRRDSPDSQSA
jgi:3'-5' exoribonuclease